MKHFAKNQKGHLKIPKNSNHLIYLFVLKTHHRNVIVILILAKRVVQKRMQRKKTKMQRAGLNG